MAESFHLHVWRQRCRPAAAFDLSRRPSGFSHAVHRLWLACASRWLARRERDPLAGLDDEQARQLSALGRERRIEARFGAQVRAP
jgi:hypothetical protein